MVQLLCSTLQDGCKTHRELLAAHVEEDKATITPERGVGGRGGGLGGWQGDGLHFIPFSQGWI